MTEPRKYTILIVDDDPDTVEALKLVLEQEGYGVATASSAEEAEAKVHAETPDLILLDVMMPTGTEGFHFVWNLRRDPDRRCREVPIIMLTAIHQTTLLKFYPDQSDGTYAPYEYLPVQGFLDKPATAEQLLSEIRSVLGSGAYRSGPSAPGAAEDQG